MQKYAPSLPALKYPRLYMSALSGSALTDVAEYAAVNETVAAVRQTESTAVTGFVNAILRRALRERQVLDDALQRQSPGIRLSHPDSLLQRWSANFSPAQAEEIAAWNNLPAEVTVTANSLKISEQSLQKAFQEQELIVRVTPSAGRKFFVVKRGVAVPGLPGYDKGWFLAADPAVPMPQLCLRKARNACIDACAAPGGKTALLAGMMQGRALTQRSPDCAAGDGRQS